MGNRESGRKEKHLWTGEEVIKMIRFKVGEIYDCESFNENDNIFRVTERTDTTVNLSLLYEVDGEMKEFSFGTWQIEVIDNVESVLIEQGCFDEDCKAYIMANWPY